MKHSVVALSALAAAAQAAVPAFTNSNYNLQVGQPFVLTFSGCETACTVKLKRGDAGDLKDAATLSSSVTGNSLTVTPSQDWAPAPVAFEISNKDGVNYSPQVSPAGLGASQRSPASASGVPPAHTRIASTTVDLDDAKETDADSSEITAAPTVTPGRLTNSSSPATTMTTRGSNSTATRSSSRTSSTSAPTSSIPSSGVNRVLASLALVAGVAAALAYLN